jgi:hypothetical protein
MPPHTFIEQKENQDLEKLIYVTFDYIYSLIKVQ